MEIPPPIQQAADQLKTIAQSHRKCEVGVTINPDYSLRPYNMETKAKDGISEFCTDHEDGVGATNIASRANNVYGETTQYRIRKLTPRECFRLMDVDDADIDKIFAHRVKTTLKSGEVKEKPIPKSQLYKLAGNSIVVSCIYHIFRTMLIPDQPEHAHQSKQLNLF